MPKREMTVALAEKTLRSSFKLDDIKIRNAPMKAINSVKIKKGTLMNAVVNVNVNLNLNLGDERDSNQGEKSGKKGGKKGSGERYIRAYQDMMGWFVPLETGGTLLIGVMKVDLGPDIPRFAFKTALAATVTWSMTALRNLSAK